ncbi:uncharacterized protein [Leuresthes tenuis]|uniref:uncharacterized protein isoform X2 n=1 Tax=Leuresthes tenuis TaxID=355514 RepID=UPI003B50AFDF
MTSCGYKNVLFLFVALITIDLSKEGCLDLFEMTYWNTTLNTLITLYSTKDDKNISECTLSKLCQGKECNQSNLFCYILEDCFLFNFSELCEHTLRRNVSLFNFRCLMAKHKEFKADGCEGFETVCKHYSLPDKKPSTQRKPTALPQTTTSTTLSQKTTMEPTTTKVTVEVSSNASVTQCVCGPTTTSVPTTSAFLSLETTETTLRPNDKQATKVTVEVSSNASVTQCVCGPTTTNAQNATNKQNSTGMKRDILMALLVLSASLNFLLPLAFCLYLHHQRRQDRRQQDSESVNLKPDGSAESPCTKGKMH